jgi:hypothetical protein
MLRLKVNVSNEAVDVTRREIKAFLRFETQRMIARGEAATGYVVFQRILEQMEEHMRRLKELDR